MTLRRLLLLAALAIAVATGALLLSKQRVATAARDRQALYPTLDGMLDAVDTLRVFKAGDVPVIEVHRNVGNGSGNGIANDIPNDIPNDIQWVVRERADYPADTAKVRQLLIALAAAKIVEEKTADAANYPAIGVEDVSAPAAAGQRVTLRGGAVAVDLIVGKQAAGSSSQYVRRANEKQSWLIDDNLDLPTTADAWLRKEIIDVSADRMQSVSVAIAGSQPYAVAKSSRSDRDFAVAMVSNEKGKSSKQLESPAAANGLSAALAGVTLTDVRKAQEIGSQQTAARATFKTFDGLVAQIDGWTEESKHYIAVAIAYDESLAQRFTAGAEAAPANTTARRDVAAESKKLAGWAYEIPQYKYEAIFKPLSELSKK